MKILNYSMVYVLDGFCIASAKILYKSNFNNGLMLNLNRVVYVEICAFKTLYFTQNNILHSAYSNINIR